MYFNQKIIVINNRWGARRRRSFLHKQRVFIFHVVEPSIVVVFAWWREKKFCWTDMSVRIGRVGIAVHPKIFKNEYPADGNNLFAKNVINLTVFSLRLEGEIGERADHVAEMQLHVTNSDLFSDVQKHGNILQKRKWHH